jgi:hypothetical protein
MTKQKQIDYHRLQTIEDVRRERIRVDYDLRHQEHLLERDRKWVAEVCSPQYWVAILSQKAAVLVEQASGTIASRIRRVISGWGIIDRLFSSFTGQSARREEEIFVEEDFYFVPDNRKEAETRHATKKTTHSPAASHVHPTSSKKATHTPAHASHPNHSEKKEEMEILFVQSPHAAHPAKKTTHKPAQASHADHPKEEMEILFVQSPHAAHPAKKTTHKPAQASHADHPVKEEIEVLVDAPRTPRTPKKAAKAPVAASNARRTPKK